MHRSAAPHSSHRRGCEKMVRGVERDEALRMSGCEEDARGMLDPDHLVARRVHDEKWALQLCRMLFDIMLADVLDEAALDDEAAARKLNLRLSAGHHAVEFGGVELGEDVRHIGGGGRARRRGGGLVGCSPRKGGG